MGLVCLAVGTVSVVAGLYFPVRIDIGTWMILLSIYTIFAAGIPVWLVLQPRDFTNVFLLYGGMGLLVLATIVAGLKGVSLNAPALNVAEGHAKIGPLFPLLFITVACGAISGFHSLVAGGTSAKQVSKESHVRHVAYGGMVLEGLMATLVVIAVGAGVDFSHYLGVVYPADKAGNPILGFAMGMGGLLQKGLGINAVIGAVFGILMVEGFVVTTLDTAVRLNRYLFEELWALVFTTVPRVMKSYLFNALLCVALMYGLARTNTIMDLWKIFGSANQLLGALTLIAVSAWLALRGARAWVALVPAAFMMVMTMTALVWVLVTDYLPKRNWVLSAADIILLVLSTAVLALSVRFVVRLRNHADARAAARA
jgi:carbon starvation protein